MTRAAHEADCVASGALRTTVHELAVANSNNLFVYYPWHRRPSFVTVVMSDSGSGYAAAAHQDLNHLDTHALGGEAIQTALRSREPIEVERARGMSVGEWYAVAGMVRF